MEDGKVAVKADSSANPKSDSLAFLKTCSICQASVATVSCYCSACSKVRNRIKDVWADIDFMQEHNLDAPGNLTSFVKWCIANGIICAKDKLTKDDVKGQLVSQRKEVVKHLIAAKKAQQAAEKEVAKQCASVDSQVDKAIETARKHMERRKKDLQREHEKAIAIVEKEYQKAVESAEKSRKQQHTLSLADARLKPRGGVFKK